MSLIAVNSTLSFFSKKNNFEKNLKDFGSNNLTNGESLLNLIEKLKIGL
jgi:hypothetical protein